MLASRAPRLKLAPRLGLVPRLIVIVAVAICLHWISRFPHSWDADELPPQAHSEPQRPASYPVNADKLVVTVKTTATEAYAKLPTLLHLTDGRDFGGLNLVSDLHMDIGAFHVHDVLDKIDPQLHDSNPELERHARQVRLARAGVDINLAKEKKPEAEKATIARMDKYKYVRMLEKAWELKPDRDWYVFMDADTYLNRPNIMEWLGQYNPTEAIFFSNPPDSRHNGTENSAFVLSGKAMSGLFVDRLNVAEIWDSRITDFRDGLGVLASTMRTELNIGYNVTWPGISTYNPLTVPYGPGIWCERVLAMHDVSPQLSSELWRFMRDRDRRTKDPLTFSDLWARFVQPQNLDVVRDNWDNLSAGPDNAHFNILFESEESSSDGRAANGEESWEACAESCATNQHCMQYSYSSIPVSNHNENGKTRCHLSRNIRMGRYVESRVVEVDGEKERIEWKSGWLKNKFNAWAQNQRCKGHMN